MQQYCGLRIISVHHGDDMVAGAWDAAALEEVCEADGWQASRVKV